MNSCVKKDTNCNTSKTSCCIIYEANKTNFVKQIVTNYLFYNIMINIKQIKQTIIQNIENLEVCKLTSLG